MHLSRAACMGATPGTLIPHKERARARTHQLCTGWVLGAPSPAPLRLRMHAELVSGSSFLHATLNGEYGGSSALPRLGSGTHGVRCRGGARAFERSKLRFAEKLRFTMYFAYLAVQRVHRTTPYSVDTAVRGGAGLVDRLVETFACCVVVRVTETGQYLIRSDARL